MRIRNTRGRSGAAAVEMAFCLVPLFMLVFGIFEYGRFMMDRNLIDNAVRAACRLALANNTDPNLLKPAAGPFVANTNPGTNVELTVTTLLGGRQNVDLQTAPTIANGLITVTGLQYVVSSSGVGSWNAVTQANIATLGPGDKITVTVNTTYKFILPIMIYIPSTIPLNSSVTMLCEGGT
jgi:Flp pilus assembly protein TadG